MRAVRINERNAGTAAELGDSQRRPATTVAAMFGILLLTSTFTLLALLGDRIALADQGLSLDVNLALGAATAAATMLLGGLLASLAPVAGRPTGIYLGLASSLLAALTLGLSELAPTFSSQGMVEYGMVRAWSLTLVFGLFTLALVASTSRRAQRLAVILGAGAMLLVVSHEWGAGSPHLVAAAWGAMVLAQALAYLATGRSRHLWVSVVLLGFFLSEIGLASQGATGVWLFGVPILRIEATALAIVGILSDLARTERNQRRELERSWARVHDLEQATLMVRRTLEERDHEARSALAAIEFTAHTMRRHASTLNEQSLTQLELAFSSELALLRRIVTLPDGEAPPETYLVREALAGMVAAARARGMDITFDVAPELLAVGRAGVAAEVAQTLFDNARIHAQGSAVEVRAWEAGDYVVVAFDDYGPGIAPDRRRRVFQRGGDGGHATSARGRGLGLYVASRLAIQEHGELWVDETRDGGASFRLSLPSGASGAGGGALAPSQERGEAQGGPGRGRDDARARLSN